MSSKQIARSIVDSLSEHSYQIKLFLRTFRNEKVNPQL